MHFYINVCKCEEKNFLYCIIFLLDYIGRHILEKFLQYSGIQSAIWFANSCSLGVETLLTCRKSEGDLKTPRSVSQQKSLVLSAAWFSSRSKKGKVWSLPSARRLEYVTEFYWGKIYLLQTFWTVWKNLDEIAQTLYINYWSPGQVPNCAKIMSITTYQKSVEQEMRKRK